MITITREHIHHEISGKHAPAAYAESGDVAVFETYDCYQGQLLPEGTTFADVDRRLGKPATGPLFVKGALPGDMLKITVEKLELGPVGILDIGPTSGALKEYYSETVIKRLPVQDGHLIYNDAVKVPLKPMIGVIGTAPAGSPVRTMAPKDHGGNMDCTRIEEGAVLYLPVFVEGGLLSCGDLHAIMGEGEVGNCGVEIEGKVTLKVEVAKDMPFKWPLIENDKQWMTVAYGDTLDEAADKAVKQMFEFLRVKSGLNAVDAGMLIDMAGDLIVCQIVNPYKTVRMEVPKKLIEDMQTLYK